MNRALAYGCMSQRLLVVGAISIALTSSVSMAEEGALQNKRLFFSHSERIEATANSVEIEPALKEQVEPVIKPIDNAVQPSVANPAPLTVKTVGIRFTAIVSGSTGVIIMINGAPCRSLPHQLSEDQGAVQVLRCPQVDSPQVSLRWLSAKQQLVVNHAELKTAWLAVGEGI